MWDVKVFYQAYQQFHVKFYLNYVGCKERGLHLGFSRSDSFTLTMWDVKLDEDW